MSTKEVLILLAGLGIGSVGTFFAVKNRYETLANEEIEAVKEYYKDKCDNCNTNKHNTEAVEDDVKENTKPSEDDKEYYNNIIQKMNYNACSNKNSAKKDVVIDVRQKEEEIPEEHAGDDEPYSITPEQFASGRLNDQISLTYFEASGFFMNNETEELISNGEELVGKWNLSKFGEYEKDVLYVRDDSTGCDYEVVLDVRDFQDTEYYDSASELDDEEDEEDN